MTEIIERLEALRIIPVIAIADAADAVPLAEALRSGGLPVAEITFRTPAAADAIERAATVDGLLLGAGTVINVDQARAAVDRGAQFIVSPGLDVELVTWCQTHSIPVFPGVATPTDITAAVKLGLEVLKFFPASAFGGLPTLDAISAPFPGLRFIPTGGISVANMGDYLASPKVIACGGSWIATTELIRHRAWDTIAERAAAAIAALPAQIE